MSDKGAAARHAAHMQPTLADLRRTFRRLERSRYRDVAGVAVFEGSPGKTIVLSCMTHGNDPCGLAAAWYLLRRKDLRDILAGRILFCVNNLEAARRYWKARTEAERKACRLCDVDMNRLSDEMLRLRDAVELRRLRELQPVFDEADLGIDLHGFPHAGPPLSIDVKGSARQLTRLSDAIPVPVRVTNIPAMQDGHPIGYFFGGPGRRIPVIEIECGVNEEPATLARAVSATLAALIVAGCLRLPHRKTATTQKLYRIAETVRFPSLSYRLLRAHTNFGEIARNEVIAEGDGPSIVASRKRRTLFGTRRLQFDNLARLAHEVLWLVHAPRMKNRVQIIPKL